MFKNYHHWKRSLMRSCTYMVATFLKRKSITLFFVYFLEKFLWNCCYVPNKRARVRISSGFFFLPCANFLGQGHLKFTYSEKATWFRKILWPSQNIWTLRNLDFSVSYWLIKIWAKFCPTYVFLYYRPSVLIINGSFTCVFIWNTKVLTCPRNRNLLTPYPSSSK